VRTADGRAVHARAAGPAPTNAQLAAFRSASAAPGARAPAAAGDGAAVRAGPCHCTGVSAEARELVHAQIGFVNALRAHLRRQDPIPEVAPFFRRPTIEINLRQMLGESELPPPVQPADGILY
jgi:hypothetical protein